jgi:hypothetical protein
MVVFRPPPPTWARHAIHSSHPLFELPLRWSASHVSTQICTHTHSHKHTHTTSHRTLCHGLQSIKALDGLHGINGTHTITHTPIHLSTHKHAHTCTAIPTHSPTHPLSLRTDNRHFALGTHTRTLHTHITLSHTHPPTHTLHNLHHAPTRISDALPHAPTHVTYIPTTTHTHTHTWSVKLRMGCVTLMLVLTGPCVAPALRCRV